MCHKATSSNQQQDKASRQSLTSEVDIHFVTSYVNYKTHLKTVKSTGGTAEYSLIVQDYDALMEYFPKP